MYNQTSLERFEEKVGYELWYLKYIAKTQDIFEGGEELTTVEFDSEIIDRVNVDIKISEIVGIGHAMNVIEAISPLTVISAYKIIDMIFEWINEGVFLIDLMHIRKKLKQIFPESDAIFNLNIFGYEDKKQTHIWKIPAYHVPDSDQLKLTYNDFLIYKI